MRLPVFASIVATPSATLPVAGTVHNTDTLLGYDGFVGVKTGSDDAAGGCFAFRAIRWIGGKRTTITGVVLGQPGHDRIAAGLAAADAMVNRIAGHAQRRVRPLPGLTSKPRRRESHRPRASGAAAPRLLRRCVRERARPPAAQPRLPAAPDRTAALDLRLEHVRDRVSAARAGADGFRREDGLRRRGRVRAARAPERRRRSGCGPFRPPPADDRLGRCGGDGPRPARDCGAHASRALLDDPRRRVRRHVCRRGLPCGEQRRVQGGRATERSSPTLRARRWGGCRLCA